MSNELKSKKSQKTNIKKNKGFSEEKINSLKEELLFYKEEAGRRKKIMNELKRLVKQSCGEGILVYSKFD